MVKGPIATVTVTQGAQVPTTIHMLPNGPVTAIIPADQTQVLVTFTGDVLDQNGVAIANLPLFGFNQSVLFTTPAFKTDASGNYSMPVIFNAPGVFMIDVSNNANNS